MHEIFLNYRRADAGGEARNLRRDLDAAFGRDTVLLDVTGLKKGLDFRRTIDQGLANCKVLLALIGPSWMEAKDEAGRRLEKGNDLVRKEIVAALGRDIPVIPVLVGGSSMPDAEHLPDDLKDLVFRDGVELTHARWDSDVQMLILALGSYVKPRPTVGDPSLVRNSLIALAVVLALCGGGWYAYHLNAEIRARDAEIAAQRAADARREAERAAAEDAKHQAEVKAASEKAEAERVAAEKAVALAKEQATIRAREKADAEARARQEAAARTKADADSRAREEAAALVKADAEARARDEAAIRAKGDAEARARQDAAARAKAEDDARARKETLARADSIASVAITRYGPTGARFEATYSIADRSPMKTGIRICINQGSQQVQGTPCAIVPLVPGGERVTVDMRFTDSTAMVIKGNGQAVVESCLVTYGSSVKAQAAVSGSCKTQRW